MTKPKIVEVLDDERGRVLMTAENPFYVVSSGAGVQSTAMLVLSAQWKIPYGTHVFANVGARAENPDTLAYVEAVPDQMSLFDLMADADECESGYCLT